MSDESTKTKSVRSPEFHQQYLQGRVIDIGGGNDPVIETAEVFDLSDGDAQHILQYREPESYNTVHSSHCLEHMRDVPSALVQWWGLVQNGGYMVIIVPHEDLYEQGVWPSAFNSDHKATFRINQKESWSNVSYDISDLASSLPDAHIIESEIHDLHYDYNLKGKRFNPILRKIYKWTYSNNRIKKLIGTSLYQALYTTLYKEKTHNTSGLPLDQTRGSAMAQIQIVIQKQIQS